MQGPKHKDLYSILEQVDTHYQNRFLYSLQRLRAIPKHPELRHYVHHLTIKEFDKDRIILGGILLGSSCQLARTTGHEKLQGILCQLENCKSFEIFTLSARDGDPLSDFTPTDAMTALPDIVTRASLPVESFTANFTRDAKPMGRNSPDPNQLQASNFQCIAVGPHLEELKLRYRITPDTIHDWTLDIIFHAPKLRKLVLTSDNVRFDCPDFTEHFSETDTPWPQLEELELSFFGIAMECFMTLIQKFQQSLRVLTLRVMTLATDQDQLRQMFWNLNTSFPALETVIFDELRSGRTGYDYVEFSVIREGAGDYDSVGLITGFEPIAYDKWEGPCRESVVSYLGLGIHGALGVLARTVTIRPW